MKASIIGPSLVGYGSSFLTRMVRDAVSDQVVEIPVEPRRVQPVDVRVASAAMWAIDPERVAEPAIEAITEPVSTDQVAALLLDRVQVKTGRRPRATRVMMEERPAPPIAPAERWLEACHVARIEQISLQRSIDDTIAAIGQEVQWSN